MNDTIEIIARLKMVINHLKLSQNAFGREIGISRSGISQLLSGKQAVTGNVIYKLNQAFPELNTNWLLTGEGEMINGAIEEQEIERLKAENAQMMAENKRLAEELLKSRELNETMRKALERIMGS